MIVPPGYKVQKEEDKNVDFGDQYIPQQFWLDGLSPRRRGRRSLGDPRRRRGDHHRDRRSPSPPAKAGTSTPTT